MNIPRIRIDTPAKEEEQALLAAFREGGHAIGPELALFQKKIADMMGLEGSVGCSNGFFALLLALKSLGLKGKHIGLPALQTCDAISSAILASGNIPVYLDCDAIGRLSLETYTNAKQLGALVSVSYFGVHNRPEILQEETGIPVIEDASQAFLTALHKKVYSKAITFSFYPTKGFGVIDGGMLLSNDSDLLASAKQVASYSLVDTNDAQGFGYNTRFNNLAAAVGLQKLNQVSDIADKNIKIRNMYESAIEGKDIAIISDKDRREVLTRFVLKFSSELIRDKFLIEANYHGIGASKEWYLSAATNRTGQMFPYSKELERTTASIPGYNSLSDTELDYVSSFLASFNGAS